MNVTERDTKKGFHWIYVLAGLYVLSAYIAPVMSYFMIKYAEDTLFPWVSLTIPISMGIVNSIVIPTNRYEIGRVRLINCAIFIKLALVPLYIVGGLLNVLFFYRHYYYGNHIRNKEKLKDCYNHAQSFVMNPQLAGFQQVCKRVRRDPRHIQPPED